MTCKLGVNRTRIYPWKGQNYIELFDLFTLSAHIIGAINMDGDLDATRSYHSR